MARRLIAAFASLVLSVAFLSAQTSLFAAVTPNCCANGMCPMLHMAVTHCDMDMSRPQPELQTCPTPNLRYVTALIFVRVAPPALIAGQYADEKISLAAAPAAPVADLSVAAPPPRTNLA